MYHRPLRQLLDEIRNLDRMEELAKVMSVGMQSVRIGAFYPPGGTMVELGSHVRGTAVEPQWSRGGPRVQGGLRPRGCTVEPEFHLGSCVFYGGPTLVPLGG
jgi:hypothetical protein